MKKNSKEDFIRELADALSGSVPSDKYYETINYYDDYFRSEMKKGKSEEQICKSLGSPRLIAKSIIESQADAVGGERIYDAPDDIYSRRSSYKEEKRENNSESRPKGWHINIDEETGKASLAFGRLDFSTILGKIVIAIILVLLICFVVGVILLGAKILFYFVLPIVMVLIIVNIIISFFSRK